MELKGKNKKQTKTFEARVKVKKRLYPKSNPEDTIFFGIYSCIPIKAEEKVELSNWGNFVIKGNTTELIEDKEYTVILSEIERSPKGDSYPLVNVKGEKLTSAKSQREFLESIITTRQYTSIIKAYPNEKILDFIMDDKVDTSKTHGIGQATLEFIKEKIRDNRELGTLVNQLAPLGVTMNSIKAISSHFGSPLTATRKINESFYNLCNIKGFGFKKVDKYALTAGESPESKHRISACIHYLLKQESSQGHSWISEEELYKKANELLDIDLIHLVEFVDGLDKSVSEDILKIKENPSYEDEQQYINYNKILNIQGKITLMSCYLDEIHTFQHLNRINVNYTPPMMSNVEQSIYNAESLLNITYSDEQKEVAKEAMSSGIYILNGKSGTGKTTTVKLIVTICEQLGLSYHGCTLSGKASMVLSSKGVTASTIHRLLKFRGESFEYDEVVKLPYDVIILDEASMVNASLWKSLTQAIADGSKLIIVGDSGQLSGIGHGDVMRDLLDSQYFNGRELKQIHRQAEDSGIIEIAHKVRNGEQLTPYVYEGIDTYGLNKDTVLFTYKERKNVSEATNKIIKSQIDKINQLPKYEREKEVLDFQVLVANKSSGSISTLAINNYIQSIYNPVDEFTPHVISGKYKYAEGDKVIVSGNSYEIRVYEVLDDYLQEVNQDDEFEDWMFEGMSEEEVIEMKKKQQEGIVVTDLFNGTIGVVEYVDEGNKTLLIRFEGVDGLILIDEDSLDTLDLAYAITVHRAQGMSIKNVLFAIDFSSFMLLSKQLVYTAITRSSGKCVVVAETGALQKSIKTDSSNSRNTFMRELLVK